MLTIHNMDPLGCSTCWEPLQRYFTVAKPKSPIFTVQPSWRKISETKDKELHHTYNTTVGLNLVILARANLTNMLARANI